MTEEPRDQQTQAEYNAEVRQRVKDEAKAAIDAIVAHQTAGAPLSVFDLVRNLAALTAEISAAWSEYHNALAACPVVVTGEQLGELYQAVADSVKAAHLATWGKQYEPRRSEEGTEPVVPEPVEPVVSGAGTAEHLP